MTAEVAPLISTESTAPNPNPADPPPSNASTSDPSTTSDSDHASDQTSDQTSDQASGHALNGESSPAADTPQALAAAPQLSPQDAVDFLLHPTEVARGRKAAENYLNTFRSDESRRVAEEALETLATVISGGHCDSLEFPWQQVRPFHGAAALTILKERGAPARIEALRCRRDTTRSYRVVPDSYAPGQVQKIRTTLTKVIAECSELGFVTSAEESAAEAKTGKTAKTGNGKRKPAARKSRPTAGRRLLGDGELRALSAACSSVGNAEGSRDAVLFALVCSGLKIAEITALTVESVRFSNRTGVCSIACTAGSKGSRGRRIELSNDELICLEDWLDYRGSGSGPLLCTLGRGGKIEGKRLTTAMLKEICERRAKQAEVVDFVPNDLSRSAEALTQHRKAARKRAARQAENSLSAGEQVLFNGAGRGRKDDADTEAIRFPFLGLGI